MSKSDTSSVFHITVLDDEHAAQFDSTLPWLFMTDNAEGQTDISCFATEAEACAMQRDYRRLHGYDEMTGESA